MCSSRCTSRPHPAARTPRFSPAFWRTLRPGASRVPLADTLSTVKTHVSSLLLKLDARARVHLVIAA
ncbi:helix-turn-helix domain-containing protein [Nonomuraea wenchangensis]|uniref:hypothetical protein n=1 Tax=Nonomuraea wenchangensis TaxID=568860 RepID=UPI001FE2CCFB|nr:hypothetical protein [Nonomuraea wenchangensis]